MFLTTMMATSAFYTAHTLISTLSASHLPQPHCLMPLLPCQPFPGHANIFPPPPKKIHRPHAAMLPWDPSLDPMGPHIRISWDRFPGSLLLSGCWLPGLASGMMSSLLMSAAVRLCATVLCITLVLNLRARGVMMGMMGVRAVQRSHGRCESAACL